MNIGYARTSTHDQVAGLEAQLRELEEAKCDKIFKEQISSLVDQRLQLEAALDFIREGDELMVTRLDRLARSVTDLLRIVERVKRKGQAFISATSAASTVIRWVRCCSTSSARLHSSSAR